MPSCAPEWKSGGSRPSRTRHVPHRDLPPEVVEKRNERERVRVTTVNGEFSRLQRLLPTIRDRKRRVSKERILRLAISHIRNLRHLLDSAELAARGQQENSLSDNLRKHSYQPIPACPSVVPEVHSTPLRMTALEDALQTSTAIFARPTFSLDAERDRPLMSCHGDTFWEGDLVSDTRSNHTVSMVTSLTECLSVYQPYNSTQNPERFFPAVPSTLFPGSLSSS